MLSAPYVHRASVHEEQAPAIMVPVINGMFEPRTVVDVGCGIGNFLGAFKQGGVVVHGVDGPWADTTRYLAHDEFTAADLASPLDLGRTFDLAISFEVAEHLPPEAADTFVTSLTALSDTIIFSAAVPFQGGQNHLNEQWPSYWIPKFRTHGYGESPVLRDLFWADARLFTWYRQNVIVFRRGVKPEPVPDVVHPAMFMSVMEGRAEWQAYPPILWRCFHEQLQTRLGFGKRR